MKTKIKTKPKKNATIITGYPGFGLVGTITTEYLINHLNTKKIGSFYSEEIPAMVAIHEGKLIDPIGVYYNNKNNIIIVHAVTNLTGNEHDFSETLFNFANKIEAKEIINLEGVGTKTPTQNVKLYSFSPNDIKRKKLASIGLTELKEGIVVGVTGLNLLNSSSKIPVSCIFAEAHSALPDSMASAKIIEYLDKYLKLNVDYLPLVKQAEVFEDKIKGIFKKTEEARDKQLEKQISYFG